MAAPPPPGTTIGKHNSLLYSLFVALFLVWQGVDAGVDRNGFYARTKEVPILTIVACSSFLAVGLGINILDTLQALKELTTRNSIALNQIKQNLPTAAEPTNQDKDDEPSSNN